jgi:hypothetical protein
MSERRQIEVCASYVSGVVKISQQLLLRARAVYAAGLNRGCVDSATVTHNRRPGPLRAP